MNLFRTERDSALLALGIVTLNAVVLPVPALGWVRAITGAVVLVFLLGHSLRCFGRRLFAVSELRPLWTTAGIVLDLLLSLVVVVCIGAILMVTFVFWEGVLVALILIMIAGPSLGTLILTLRKSESPMSRAPMEPQVLHAILILSGLAIGTFAGLRATEPYPSVPGWDLHPTLATVGWSIEKHGFAFVLIPPFPASAVLPYPAAFAQLIASYSLFLGVPPLSIFYYGPLLLVIVYLLAAFGIAYRLSGHVASSTIAAVALLSLSLANPNTIRTPIFLAIDMVAQLIFLGILSFYLYDEGSIRARRIVVSVGFAFLVYFYFYDLIVATPIAALMLLESSTTEGRRRQTGWFTVLLLILIAGVGAADAALAILSPSTAANLNAPLPLGPKVGILWTIYSPAFIVLFAFAFLQYRKSGSREIKGLQVRHLLLYSAALLVIYLLPIWATYRVEFYFRWALAVLVALIPFPSWAEIRAAYAAVRGRLRVHRSGPSADSRSTARVLILLLLVALLVVPIPGYLETQVPSMSGDEYRASAWIHDNTAQGAYVVTDPGSGFVVRGLSLRNASTSFILPDGRAPADWTPSYPNLLVMLHFVFVANTTRDAHDRVLALGFADMYVLISTRTVVWSQERAEAVFLWPFPDRNPATMLPVFLEPGFSIVFASPSVYVLRVHP